MINKAAVIGAGHMGSGIARHLCRHQVDVLVTDTSPAQLAQLAQLEGAGSAPGNQTMRFTTELADLKDRDFVIEAVFEDLSVKHEVLQQISSHVRSDCVIASNTSSLLIEDLSQPVAHPERFVGVHYNHPADQNPVVEIIASAKTDESIAAGIHRWMRQADKLAIRCADTPCFVLNRQSLPYINEAARCLDIATPGEIDQIATSRLGAGSGPFAVMNLVGLPVMAAASRNLAVLGSGYAPASALQERNEPWKMDRVNSIDRKVTSDVIRRLRGAMIFPAKDILDQGLCSRDDLHEICIQALGYQRSSVEWLEILTPGVREELISIYLGKL